MSRGWGAELVPVFDMINHHNGPRYNNIIRSNHPDDGNGYIVTANQDILAGQQLFITYNQCIENEPICANISKTFVTQHLFWEYGFVEDYPRRWAFLKLQDGTFEIIFEQNRDEHGNVSLQWLMDGNEPTKKHVSWMLGQVERLKGMMNHVHRVVGDLVHDYEGSMSLSYYEALKGALVQAVTVAQASSFTYDDDRRCAAN